MKLKQLLAFTTTVLATAAIICLTGAVANRAIPLWQYLIWMIAAGIVLQLAINCLDKLISDGEWV